MKKVNIPIYNLDIAISFCKETLSKKGIEIEKFNKGEVAPYEQQVRGYLYQYVLIYIDLKTFDINTLCHESVHAAWRVLDQAGIQVDSGNHETLAYLTGWIADKVHKEYIKQTKEETNG